MMVESNADLIRTVECEMMPGLAQCETYVRALFEARQDDDPQVVEDLVQARLARQTVVLEGTAEYRVVMSESCLRRVRGGPEVMREQFDNLSKLSQRPNVLIQLVPFTAKHAPSIEIRFAIVRVPPTPRSLAGPGELAYVAGVGEVRYLDEPNALATHGAARARLNSHALNAEDTRSFMLVPWRDTHEQQKRSSTHLETPVRHSRLPPEPHEFG